MSGNDGLSCHIRYQYYTKAHSSICSLTSWRSSPRSHIPHLLNNQATTAGIDRFTNPLSKCRAYNTHTSRGYKIFSSQPFKNCRISTNMKFFVRFKNSCQNERILKRTPREMAANPIFYNNLHHLQQSLSFSRRFLMIANYKWPVWSVLTSPPSRFLAHSSLFPFFFTGLRNVVRRQTLTDKTAVTGQAFIREK